MKRFVTEPLLQFLVLGAGLFAAYAFLHRSPEAQPDGIAISAGQIEQMAATFARFHQRPATAEELKGLIDQYVREEVLAREAVILGLDQDDAVIRRRLHQKMEFIATDLAAAQEPTEAELAGWLATHPDNFRQERQFSFRHIYLSPDKRGDHFDADVAALLADLRPAREPADANMLGDGLLLPHEFTDEPESAVAAQFGPEFVEQLGTLNTGEWSGPIRSGYGMHLVLLNARSESGLPALDEVRELVMRDLMNQRRLEANRRFLDALLAKYNVTIQWPEADVVSAGTAMAETP